MSDYCFEYLCVLIIRLFYRLCFINLAIKLSLFSRDYFLTYLPSKRSFPFSSFITD